MQKSPRTPTLPIKQQQSPNLSPIQEFKKKKFKQFFFRNYKATTQPGIVIFLLKQTSQEILENLIFETFRRSYKGIVIPNFLYFDSQKKVIKFKQIKPDSIVYFYITESDIDQNSNQDIRYSEQQPEFFSTIEEQKNNLDLFVLKETEYLDYLNGNKTLDNVQQSYAQLQFFLERCYKDVWDYLEDFAEVSYQRRKRFAKIADNIDKKREEIFEVTQLMQSILNEFEEQEKVVRQQCEKMGFENDFIDKAVTIQQRSQLVQSRIHNTQPLSSEYNQNFNKQSLYNHKEAILLNELPDSPHSDFQIELFLPKNAKEV